MVTDAVSAPGKLLFRQLFDSGSSTFTYILADAASKEAVMIDPVLEQVACRLAFENRQVPPAPATW